jgi:hypothetical protein
MRAPIGWRTFFRVQLLHCLCALRSSATFTRARVRDICTYAAVAKNAFAFPLGVSESELFASVESEKTLDNPGVLRYHAFLADDFARRWVETS